MTEAEPLPASYEQEPACRPSGSRRCAVSWSLFHTYRRRRSARLNRST
ncbi:hypothetical protein [Nonomuraea salmonea]